VQSLDAQGANLKHAAHCTALGGLSLIAGWAPGHELAARVSECPNCWRRC
jgi:hypothetical protein